MPVQYLPVSERHFTRLVLSGRLTGQDADAVRRVIAEVKTGKARRYLLDLGGLEFIDSAGIGMLLVVNGEATAAGRPLAMLPGSGQVRTVVELTRIAMIIPAFATVEDYVAAAVPEAALVVAPCAPGEDPLALAARALHVTAAAVPSRA